MLQLIQNSGFFFYKSVYKLYYFFKFFALIAASWLFFNLSMLGLMTLHAFKTSVVSVWIYLSSPLSLNYSIDLINGAS